MIVYNLKIIINFQCSKDTKESKILYDYAVAMNGKFPDIVSYYDQISMKIDYRKNIFYDKIIFFILRENCHSNNN